MKKKLLAAALVVGMSTHFAIGQPEKAATGPLKPLASQTQAALWASRVLARYHYKAVPLDDAMSEKIFDRYFKALDPEKVYFQQADLEQFASVRNKLDDAI